MLPAAPPAWETLTCAVSTLEAHPAAAPPPDAEGDAGGAVAGDLAAELAGAVVGAAACVAGAPAALWVLGPHAAVTAATPSTAAAVTALRAADDLITSSPPG